MIRKKIGFLDWEYSHENQPPSQTNNSESLRRFLQKKKKKEIAELTSYDAETWRGRVNIEVTMKNFNLSHVLHMNHRLTYNL